VRLTALVDSPEHVCCRYRLAAFRPMLERAGHQLDLRPWPRHWWSWFLLRGELRQADAVILQRRLLQPWQLRLVRRVAPLLIYDFDDAVFLRDSYAVKGLRSFTRLRRFGAAVSAADAVVAGNDFLAEQARAFADGPVYVVPTCVDPSLYPPARHEAATTVQVVWIGSSSTLRGLETQKSVLNNLGQRLPHLRLKLICDRFFELPHLPVLACPWSENYEASELAAADISISWIPDDLWSRGKCGLKVLQYMAAGLPVVANPVGVHSEIIRHGETGLLAADSKEWAEAIAALAQDPSLRRRMGQAGRQRVEQEYSVARGGVEWNELLARLARTQALAG
jgi:glycosyltransferase involved in cell wall biosynthesis